MPSSFSALNDHAPTPPLPPPPLLGGEGGGPLNPTTQTPTEAHPTKRTATPIRRWRVVGRCPCCLSAWVLDIDAPEDPTQSWPDPSRMADALLCGSCQARRRVLFRTNEGRTVSLWTASDVGDMARNLHDRAVDLVPAVTKSRDLLPDDQPGVDQIEAVLGRFRRLSVVGMAFLQSVGIDWSRYIAEAIKTPKPGRDEA